MEKGAEQIATYGEEEDEESSLDLITSVRLKKVRNKIQTTCNLCFSGGLLANASEVRID